MSAQDAAALRLLFTGKKRNKIYTNLSSAHCGLETRSSVVFHCSQREKKILSARIHLKILTLVRTNIITTEIDGRD